MPVPTIYPSLRYDDARRAIRWLQQAFGFEIGAVVPPGDEGDIAHAELFHGNGGIMLGQAREDQPSVPSPGYGIYVVVADVDAHHARAAAAGAEIVAAPYDTDYGSREYTARDVEGKTWHFGTYAPERTW